MKDPWKTKVFLFCVFGAAATIVLAYIVNVLGR